MFDNNMRVAAVVAITVLMVVVLSFTSFSPSGANTVVVGGVAEPHGDRLSLLPSAATVPPTTAAPTESPAELSERLAETTSWLLGDDKVLTNASHRVLDLPLAVALRQYHRSSFDHIKNGELEVNCALTMMQTQNCDAWAESLAACVHRIGRDSWEKLLGARCLQSGFWRKALPDLMAADARYAVAAALAPAADAWKSLKRGLIWDSQIWKDGDTQRYVPPAQRTYAEFPPVRVCSNGCKTYPVGFGVPKSYFVDKVPRTKSFEWMPLMPKPTPAHGAYEAAIEDEDLFREMYSQSYFAWTHARGGWDCLRHYEIIAAGSVPFFYDIDRCPRNSLGHLPKELLLKARSLPGVNHIMTHGSSYTTASSLGGVNFKKHGHIDATHFNVTAYYELADEILAFGRKHLTAGAVVAYMLKMLGIEEPKHVLVVTRMTFDYIEATTMFGLAELGIRTTIVNAQMEYLYKMRTPDGKKPRNDRDEMLRPHYPNTYGAAFGFACRLGDTVNRPFDSNPDDGKYSADVRAGKYDLIIYAANPGSYRWLQEAKQAGAKVAFLQYRDGSADPDSATMHACEHGPVFVREMNDRGC